MRGTGFGCGEGAFGVGNIDNYQLAIINWQLVEGDR